MRAMANPLCTLASTGHTQEDEAGWRMRQERRTPTLHNPTEGDTDRTRVNSLVPRCARPEVELRMIHAYIGFRLRLCENAALAVVQI